MTYLFLLAALLGGLQAPAEKASRTPAQRKIDSQILYEIYRLRGETARKNVPASRTGVKIDEKQRALVDVRADVTLKLQTQIKNLGGMLVSSSREHRTIVAWIPLLVIEQLAADPAVRAIGLQREAATFQ